jgi:hypothetical protein
LLKRAEELGNLCRAHLMMGDRRGSLYEVPGVAGLVKVTILDYAPSFRTHGH